MPFDFDLDAMALKTGISTDRLSANLSAYEAMSRLFPMLEAAGCAVGLFGGTALNKIYFGKLQRLSYDIDIFSYSMEKAMLAMKSEGAIVRYSGRMPANQKGVSVKMDYLGISVDLVASSFRERPAKMQAYDLLYYYGLPMPPIVVPSYTLEFLLAEKTIALIERNELKDIYDVWVGRSLVKDQAKYARRLTAASRRHGIRDIKSFSLAQIENMLSNSAYYENRSIEAAGRATASTMLKDIMAFISSAVE